MQEFEHRIRAELNAVDAERQGLTDEYNRKIAVLNGIADRLRSWLGPDENASTSATPVGNHAPNSRNPANATSGLPKLVFDFIQNQTGEFTSTSVVDYVKATQGDGVNTGTVLAILSRSYKNGIVERPRLGVYRRKSSIEQDNLLGDA